MRYYKLETYVPEDHAEAVKTARPEENVYRLGGNSCLSGDYMGSWKFPEPLRVGQEIIFEDMIHYTTVKTCMFNGIPHPSIVFERLDGTRELLREYNFNDYLTRMD